MTNHYEDDIFRRMTNFHRNLMDDMLQEIRDLERAVKDGTADGRWNVRPIERPGVRGFVAQGQFQLEPKATHIPRRAFQERREPLTDIFNEEDKVRIAIELPGVDKKDIQLNVTERFAEVKAKGFSKTMALPTENVDSEKTKANYKNGVLEVIIPKIAIADDKTKRTIKIE